MLGVLIADYIFEFFSVVVDSTESLKNIIMKNTAINTAATYQDVGNITVKQTEVAVGIINELRRHQVGLIHLINGIFSIAVEVNTYTGNNAGYDNHNDGKEHNFEFNGQILQH